MNQPAHRTETSLNLEGEAAVGRVAIWAAWLEASLAELTSTLLNGVNGAGSAVTNELASSKLIDLSKRLLKNKYANIPQELQDKTLNAINKASAALQRRNQILHATVGGSLTPGMTAFHSRKRPGTAQHHSVDELDVMGEQLHTSMNEIFDCAFEVATFMKKR